MNGSFPKSSANNLPGRLINNYLGFECVVLFLPTVVSSLLFFGRSIGLSVTSTTITCQLLGC